MGLRLRHGVTSNNPCLWKKTPTEDSSQSLVNSRQRHVNREEKEANLVLVQGVLDILDSASDDILDAPAWR